MLALWKPDLWTSRKAACSKRSRVRSGSRNLRFIPDYLTYQLVCMLFHPESQPQLSGLGAWLLTFLNFIPFPKCVYENLENQPFCRFEIVSGNCWSATRL
jgi:hypothetical protein